MLENELVGGGCLRGGERRGLGSGWKVNGTYVAMGLMDGSVWRRGLFVDGRAGGCWV